MAARLPLRWSLDRVECLAPGERAVLEAINDRLVGGRSVAFAPGGLREIALRIPGIDPPARFIFHLVALIRRGYLRLSVTQAGWIRLEVGSCVPVPPSDEYQVTKMARGVLVREFQREPVA